MKRRGQAIDRDGRTWTATVVSEVEAEEADFRFWYEGLSPDAIRQFLGTDLGIKSRDLSTPGRIVQLQRS